MWDFSLSNYCIADLADVEFHSSMFDKTIFKMSTTDRVTVDNGRKKENAITFTCSGCGASPIGHESNCRYCGRRV